jgi:hypothetical protein
VSMKRQLECAEQHSFKKSPSARTPLRKVT